MICKVKKTIEKFQLLDNVKSVAVGVSGGADSMCLLEILSKLKNEYGITVKAVHLNHNIRGKEAERDEAFVKNYCEKNGIDLTVFSENIPALSKELNMSEEECGRKIRYDCFAKMNCDAVALAHSLSDSVETILFNLMRGSGAKGLSGIPVKRAPNIIRPLIECKRAEIERYCAENDIDYITDSTNLSDDYSRNYIRHNIVSAFKKLNPDFENAVIRSANILDEGYSFTEECAKELILKSKTENGYRRDKFSLVHPYLRKEAFKLILGKKMQKDVEARHVYLCEEAFILKKGKIELEKDLYIDLSGDIISFCTAENESLPWTAEACGDVFVSPHGQYALTDGTISDKDSFDADKIKNKICLSSRKEGDKFYYKKRGITKSFKKLFNELKIPKEQRNKIAILRDGENVVWVEGIGTNGDYLPDIKTNKIFKITKLKDGQ